MTRPVLQQASETSSTEARVFTMCMVGAHSSGKTSYLGALWSNLRDDHASGSDLRLDGPLPEGTAYLDAAAYALEGVEPVERTVRGTGEGVELSVRLREQSVTLRQLDIAGETLEHILKDRIAPQPLVDWVSSADGVMLFVNPTTVVGFSGIGEARALQRALGNAPEPLQPGSTPPRDGLISDEGIWKLAPTAVQLVDLLQVAAHLHGNPMRPLPVVVVVSAWDTEDSGLEVFEASQDPETWVAVHLPLLHQFLQANETSAPYAIFGISAQGWDYNNLALSERLGHLPLRDRVRVVCGHEVTVNVHAPIIWLLDNAP